MKRFLKLLLVRDDFQVTVRQPAPELAQKLSGAAPPTPNQPAWLAWLGAAIMATMALCWQVVFHLGLRRVKGEVRQLVEN